MASDEEKTPKAEEEEVIVEKVIVDPKQEKPRGKTTVPKPKTRPTRLAKAACSKCGKEGTRNYIEYVHECGVLKVSPKRSKIKAREAEVQAKKEEYEPSSPKNILQTYRSLNQQRQEEKKALFKSWLN